MGKFFDGYKTYAAGFASMASGIGLMINGFMDGNWDQVQAGWLMVIAGLGGIGIGRKLEKQ
jgi:urea transporter